MPADCCTNTDKIMLLACSGASNAGQLSNQAAVELTQEGFGKMSCLAGIGGQLSGFVQSAKDVPLMVVIDGCAVGCAKAILKNAQVPLDHYLVLTDEGIEKNKNFDLERPQLLDGFKTNCRKCGQPACMGFAVQVVDGGRGVEH